MRWKRKIDRFLSIEQISHRSIQKIDVSSQKIDDVCVSLARRAHEMEKEEEKIDLSINQLDAYKVLVHKSEITHVHLIMLKL